MDLHTLARELAGHLREPDKKQLRFNEIVACAEDFYNNPVAGVQELILACDKSCQSLYSPDTPMWRALRTDYVWMLAIRAEMEKM